MKSSIILCIAFCYAINVHAQNDIPGKIILESIDNPNPAFHGRSEGDLLDSSLTWLWNDVSLLWENDGHDIYQYDDHGNRIVNISSVWNGTSYVNSRKSISTYNANDDRVLLIDQTWDGAQWVNFLQTIYTVDDLGYATEIIIQGWNGIGWQNYFHFVYTYTVDYQRLATLTQDWDETDWVNKSLITNTYNNGKLEIGLNQNWEGADWVNGTQDHYTYNGDGLVQQILTEVWDEDTWREATRNTLEYDVNGNNTHYLRERSVNGDPWQNFYQITREFDDYNNLSTELKENWSNDAWENDYYYAETYDTRQNFTAYLVQYWLDEWVNSDSGHYYYTLASAIEPSPVILSQVSIFPNPAAQMIQISTGSLSNNANRVSLYSLSGELLMEKSVTSKEISFLDVSSLLPGLYYVSVSSDQGIETKSILKL